MKFINPDLKNLCFSNAVTTSLLNLKAFQEILKIEASASECTILAELKRLSNYKNHYKSSTLTLRRTVQGECLRSGQLLRTFDDNEQHDAAEFLNSIFEHMSKKSQNPARARESLCGGLSQKTMFCLNSNCNMSEQLQVEALSEIIPIEFTSLSLESCIEQFFSPEEIERRCHYCETKRSTQVTSFIQDPVTLILQLNRFKYNQLDKRVIKINEQLIFPMEITLPSGSNYKLAATVNHIGETADSGHYTCLVVDQTNSRCFLVDDSSASTASAMDEEISKQVYLLFYIKQGKQ